MNTKLVTIFGTLALLLSLALFGVAQAEVIDPIGATICFPYQGCTGIGSVTTSQVGYVLTVSSTNPFQYKLIATSSFGFVETDPIWSAFLLNPVFTNLTSTNFFATNTLFINATSTNLFASALTFTTANGTSITTTNANATNLSFTNATGTNITSTKIYASSVVSIGTTSQLYPLNVGGKMQAQYYYFTDNPTPFFSSDSGGIVFNGGYLFAAGAGTGLYVANASVFRGALSNDTSAALTINGGTSGITNFVSKIGINSSTPIATLGVKGIAGTDPVNIASSTNAQLFAVKQNGQVVVGANSLSQTGALTVESASTNNVALSFTDGVNYTAQLGREPGTSGRMFVGGPAGTSLNLWAGGSARMSIIQPSGYIGVNSTTPSTQFVVVGTSTLDGAFLQTGLGDCSAENQTVNYTLATGKFSCLTDDTGSGGGVNNVGTSTANYFTFYTSSTAVTGTPWVQFSNGALTVTTNTNFTIVSSSNSLFTNVSTTNLYVSGNLRDRNGSPGILGDLLISTGTSSVWVSANSACNPLTTDCTLVDQPSWVIVAGATGCPQNTILIHDDVGYSCSTDITFDYAGTKVFSVADTVSSTNAIVNGGTLTTTNLVVTNSLTLPNDSVTDAMVNGSLTLTGGSINGVPIGATTPSTGIFTSLTSSIFFATTTRLINATTTNLYVSGLTNLAGATTFTTATGTSITSTNLYISSLSNFAGAMTFSTASGTSITSTNAFFSSLAFTNANGTSITTTNANFTTLNVTNSSTFRTNTVSGGFFQTGLGDCSLDTQTLNYNATSGKFTCLTDDTGGGGGAAGGVNTSTANYFAFYLSATAVTGTSDVIFSNGALTINTTTNFFAPVSMSSTLQVYDIATFGYSPTGTILFNYTPKNQTSTIQIVIPDPDYLLVGTAVASTLATYSDDLTRIPVYSTVAGTGALSIKNMVLAPNNSGQNASYNNAGTLQTITAQTLGGQATSVIKGAITCGGYHYAFVTSTASGSAQAYIKRATSTWSNDIAVFANWATSTISGTALSPVNLGLVGCANGNVYVASTTTTIEPYAITTSNNTLTRGSEITISGASITLAGTRVNDNGIYAPFGSAPFVRKFDFSGNQLYPAGSGRGQAAVAANGPDMFVTQRSYYSAGNTVAGAVFVYKQSF